MHIWWCITYYNEHALREIIRLHLFLIFCQIYNRQKLRDATKNMKSRGTRDNAILTGTCSPTLVALIEENLRERRKRAGKQKWLAKQGRWKIRTMILIILFKWDSTMISKMLHFFWEIRVRLHVKLALTELKMAITMIYLLSNKCFLSFIRKTPFCNL